MIIYVMRHAPRIGWVSSVHVNSEQVPLVSQYSSYLVYWQTGTDGPSTLCSVNYHLKATQVVTLNKGKQMFPFNSSLGIGLIYAV